MLEKFGGLHYIDFERMVKYPLVVDAGACMGKYIEVMKESIPHCKIIAIECDKENMKILKEKNFSNVTLCEQALVGFRPRKKLVYHRYVGLPYSGSVGYEKTYIKEKAPSKFKGIETYTVGAFGINNIFSKFNIDRIDYLKMNIEGAERDVLMAMTKETASKIDQISISIHTKIREDLDNSQMKKSAGVDVLDRLIELGFTTSKVYRRLVYGFMEV